MQLNWERTPLACGLRRHAANFQPTDFTTPNRGPIMENKTDGGTPSVARGTPALPMNSTAWIRLRFRLFHNSGSIWMQAVKAKTVTQCILTTRWVPAHNSRRASKVGHQPSKGNDQTTKVAGLYLSQTLVK